MKSGKDDSKLVTKPHLTNILGDDYERGRNILQTKGI
jgi:hypothetical protein